MTCALCYTELAVSTSYCHVCGASSTCELRRLRHAGFWRRVAAVIIDLMFIGSPVFYVFDRVIPPQTKEEEEATKNLFRDRLPAEERTRVQSRFIDRAVYFAEVVFFVAMPYYVYTEGSSWQGTLGKRLLGLKVTDVNGRRIRRGRALGRYLSRVLAALPFQFGFVMASFTARKQALHDMMTGTLVVLDEQPKPE
jgi:uncharacterized RDD family membrane protein YckC